MKTDSHLAIWHNVWRLNQAAGMKSSATYGSATSDVRLLDLHASLHETQNDIPALEHQHASVVSAERHPPLSANRATPR